MTKQKPLEGDLIDKKLIAKHTRYKLAYEKGLANACMALFKIRAEKTYIVDGYNSFPDFLEEWAVGRAQGYALAAAGPVFRLLEKSGDSGLVTSIDQLRPISKMAPDRQLAVVQLAATKTDKKRRDGLPMITKELIEAVAAEHFSWFPKDTPSKEGDEKSPVLTRLEKACKTIVEIPLSAEEVVQEFGDGHHIGDLIGARDKLNAIVAVNKPEGER